ncbi:MAG: HEAT repeat domain-containing protein [Chloroflexota bacterium]
MSRRADLAAQLREVPAAELEAWLEARSGLPGPRANLELLDAVGDVVAAERLLAWSELTPQAAPSGTSREYLPVCGVAGIGRLLVEAGAGAEGSEPLLAPLLAPLLGRLLAAASDPRWRVREAVAIALQRWGDAGMAPLLAATDRWADSSDRLVQRAVVAALCEPRLLREPATAAHVARTLDAITATLAGAPDRRSEPYRVLRQALAYGWSVAVAADPLPGWATFGRWVDSDDPDVAWLVRQNLGKRRMPPRPVTLS